jgi:hypothetical protein
MQLRQRETELTKELKSLQSQLTAAKADASAAHNLFKPLPLPAPLPTHTPAPSTSSTRADAFIRLLRYKPARNGFLGYLVLVHLWLFIILYVHANEKSC